jgi:hypothetical protein
LCGVRRMIGRRRRSEKRRALAGGEPSEASVRWVWCVVWGGMPHVYTDTNKSFWVGNDREATLVESLILAQDQRWRRA